MIPPVTYAPPLEADTAQRSRALFEAFTSPTNGYAAAMEEALTHVRQRLLFGEEEPLLDNTTVTRQWDAHAWIRSFFYGEPPQPTPENTNTTMPRRNRNARRRNDPIPAAPE